MAKLMISKLFLKFIDSYFQIFNVVVILIGLVIIQEDGILFRQCLAPDEAIISTKLIDN